MLHSTQGIVLHSVKYSESSVIVKIYTGSFGLQSYIFRGIRNSKSKVRPGLFQPLTLLDLVVYHREKQSIQSVKEVRLAHPYQTIPFDIRKSSVALFINELIYKAIREEEPNPALFEFLWSSCLLLDATKEPVADFHLLFALQLCHHLGIFPHANYSSACTFFNLREGLFQSSIPGHPQYLDSETSERFYELILSSGEQNTREQNARDQVTGEQIAGEPNPVVKDSESQYKKIRLPATRARLLEIILLYYQLHLPGFREIRSHHILHEVLS